MGHGGGGGILGKIWGVLVKNGVKSEINLGDLEELKGRKIWG